MNKIIHNICSNSFPKLSCESDEKTSSTELRFQSSSFCVWGGIFLSPDQSVWQILKTLAMFIFTILSFVMNMPQIIFVFSIHIWRKIGKIYCIVNCPFWIFLSFSTILRKHSLWSTKAWHYSGGQLGRGEQHLLVSDLKTVFVFAQLMAVCVSMLSMFVGTGCHTYIQKNVSEGKDVKIWCPRTLALLTLSQIQTMTVLNQALYELLQYEFTNLDSKNYRKRFLWLILIVVVVSCGLLFVDSPLL